MSLIEPRTSVVTLYQGDDLDRIRHIERQHEAAVEAEKASGPLLGGEIAESVALAEKHAEEKAKAEARAVHVKVRAVRRSLYRELADKHPPRTGDDVDPDVVLVDAKMGVNEEAFKVDLVPAAIVNITHGETVTDWASLSEDDRADFLDTITESDFELLFLHAYGLVNNYASAPKALALPDSRKSPESAEN